MKKVISFLLAAVCVLGICCGTAFADADPGDEVTVTVTITSADAVMARAKMVYDRNALTFVSAASNDLCICPISGEGSFVFGWGTSSIGTMTATITFKAKCVPEAGSYPVSLSVFECLDKDTNPASATVTGGTVAIKKGIHVPVAMDPVYATTEAPGSWGGTRCTVCGGIVDEPVITPVIETARVLILPDDVTSIGAEAFAGVDAVRAELPVNITDIGSRAFYGSDITQISIAASSVTIASDAFDGLDPDELFFYVPAGSAVAALLGQMGAGVVIEMPVTE